MKKAFSLVFSSLFFLAFSACQPQTAQIVMIPDAAGIDDGSFNQGAWEGIRLYAGVSGKSCNYYQPSAQNDEAYLAAVRKGIRSGAEVVVLPGQAFSFAVGEAQTAYPDVCFILLDAAPADGAAENTVGITFAEEQAGYLAGYAAVRDGYQKLGFIGGAPVPGVVGYGFGYVQGAVAAAQELQQDVEMRYAYNGQFVENAAAKSLAESWYADGTEVIFACGGAMNRSIFAAAEAAGKKTIGADVDQSGASSSVLTSAVKALGLAAGQTLEEYYEGDFPGGQTLVLGAAEGAVGLAMENSRFQSFSQEEYEQLLTALREGDITVSREGRQGEGSVSPEGLAPAQGHFTLLYVEG